MTTQTTDYRREHDMMSTPDKWPHWPFLPLEHRLGESTLLGFMVRGTTDPAPAGKFRVYIGNIFMPRYDNYTDYESVDAIIAAGWRAYNRLVPADQLVML